MPQNRRRRTLGNSQKEALADRISRIIEAETMTTSGDALNAAWSVIDDLEIVATDNSRMNGMIMFQTAWLERVQVN